jgi:hypothetical protein
MFLTTRDSLIGAEEDLAMVQSWSQKIAEANLTDYR